MEEKRTHKVRNIILIVAGVIVSLAGIIYIVTQYSKKLTSHFKKEEAEDEGELTDSDLESQFKQVDDGEGTPPDVIEEDDLTVEITEETEEQ